MRALSHRRRCGFVGRHLVDHLRASGDDVVTRRPPRRALDITDAEALRAAVADAAPDAVYHLAGWADVGGVLAATRSRCSASTPRARSTCSEACAPAGVDRVLAVASADVYGVVSEAELPLDERLAAPSRPAPTRRPRSPPTSSAQQAFLGHGLGVIRVRPFNHLGPGQSEQFVAPAIAARIARAERDGSRGHPGRQPVAPAGTSPTCATSCGPTGCSSSDGEPGEVYNVCSGRDLAIQHLADRLVSLARRPMRSRPTPTLHAPGRTCRCCGATRRSCTRPPAGRPRSRSSRPWPTCSTTGAGPGV